MSISKIEPSNTDPFDSERGRPSRERMEAMGFWGAVWSKAELPPYLRAAQEGDAHRLAHLLYDDPRLANVQEIYVPNETALHKAARGGQAACALVLTANGASPFSLNDQGYDPLIVLLDSFAPEASLLSIAHILQDARENSRISVGSSRAITALSVVYQNDGCPEYTRQMRRAAEEFERTKVLIAARRLRASQHDCPRLCAHLLRTEAPKHPAVSTALRLAVDAGHLETARVLCEWLRLHADVIDMPDMPPSDPFPLQSVYHLCAACLAWWIVSSDPACSYCGTPTAKSEANARRLWRHWGKLDTTPPCIEFQERIIHHTLWDLAARAMRIWDSQALVAGVARSDSTRALETRLAQADLEVRSLQDDYGHCLWLGEVAQWWNLLETAVAGWEVLSFKECERRIKWCSSLRGHWRSTLVAWERWDAIERLGQDVRGEPDVIAQARQAVYACGQVQQSLLAVRTVLALRHNGQVGNGARLPACRAEPYSARVRVMTDLTLRQRKLDERLACLG